MRVKKVTLVGIVILVLSLVMQIGLFVSSRIGVREDSPVLVMYGFDDKLFPHTSFGNSVRAAGFDYVILNKNLSKSLEIEEDISLPRGYRSRDIVYLTYGSDSTSALKLFDADEDTLGFILVNPEFETNFSMEGMSSTYPVHDVAIFNGSEASDKDARLMYERLSGEDTLYGVKYETGGIFSSECYSNPMDNRFISLSSFNYSSVNAMMTSPVFQIELANYLVSNYGDTTDVGTGSIVFWYSIYVFSSILFISGLLLVVTQLPVIKFKTNPNRSNGLRTASLITIGVVTLALVVGVILLIYIPKFSSIRLLCVSLTPLVIIIVMALLRFVYVLKNSEVKASIKAPAWYIWFLSASLILVAFMLFINTWGIENFKVNGIYLLVILFAVVLDFASVLVLAAADNISRLVGDGGCSYYGRLLFALFTAIPPIVALIVGSFEKITDNLLIGFFGIAAAVIPYAFSVVVKKRSLSTLQVSIVHSLLYLIILFLVA